MSIPERMASFVASTFALPRGKSWSAMCERLFSWSGKVRTSRWWSLLVVVSAMMGVTAVIER